MYEKILEVIIWLGWVVVAFGIIGTLMGVWMLLTDQDEGYRKKRQEFLRQKYGVQEGLEGGSEGKS